MALYEIAADDELVPFRRLSGETGLYEREIEDLVWSNPEEILGEPLFRIARQPVALNIGGRPDVVALDGDARVVVVEIKRDVDRSQLAQCLEYAGWGRTAPTSTSSRRCITAPRQEHFSTIGSNSRTLRIRH